MTGAGPAPACGGNGVTWELDPAVWRQVVEVNLLAPVYWALEMVARIAEMRQAAGLRRWQPTEDDQAVGVLRPLAA